MQDRVEGAALLEAAELRGDESDAELDSDADSDDLELGSEIELESDTEAESDAEAGSGAAEPPDEAESDAGKSDAGDSVAGESDAVGPDAAESDAAADSDNATVRASELGGEDTEETEQHSGSDQAQPAADDDVASDSAEADSGEEAGSGAESASGADDGDIASTSDHPCSNDGASEAEESDHAAQRQNKPKLPPAADSLQTLKKKLAAAKQGQGVPQEAEEGSVPIEWGRVLTAEDFERIKELRHRSGLDQAHLALTYAAWHISIIGSCFVEASFALHFWLCPSSDL